MTASDSGGEKQVEDDHRYIPPNRLIELYGSLYEDLKVIARHYLRRYGQRKQTPEAPSTTTVVHQTWIRMAKRELPKAGTKNEAEFMILAARAMRDELIDVLRFNDAKKRKQPKTGTPVDGVESKGAIAPEDRLMMLEALDEMAEWNPAAAQTFEMHHCLGYSATEIAEVLHVSVSTVRRRRFLARRWAEAFEQRGEKD